jgi:hypothetical protein
MKSFEKQNRIVEARKKLKGRSEEKMKHTPSVGYNNPRGTEAPNGVVCQYFL